MPYLALKFMYYPERLSMLKRLVLSLINLEAEIAHEHEMKMSSIYVFRIFFIEYTRGILSSENSIDYNKCII